MTHAVLSSVCFCVVGVPHTGRMHQIRVHLQWLGYPIINDPIYNHESWGPLRGQGGVSDQLVHKVCTAIKLQFHTKVIIWSWFLDLV